MPHITPDPLPTVASPEPEWVDIEPGAGQGPTYGHYQWSPDFDWWRDFRLVDNIKFTAKPPERPW